MGFVSGVVVLVVLGMVGFLAWRVLEVLLAEAVADRALVRELARLVLPEAEGGVSSLRAVLGLDEVSVVDEHAGWDPLDAAVPDVPAPYEPPWPVAPTVDPEGAAL